MQSVAIKGKAKRSQGRPVRRPATGPRVASVERRQPWYRATAFPVTLAVVALAVTVVVAANRVHEGYARDDVRRFTDQLRVQTDQLPAVLGAGTARVPGFASATDLTGGKVTPQRFAVRATGWSAALDQIRQRISALQVGPAPPNSSNGNPTNDVGGHEPLLSSVRAAYAAGIGFYEAAADTYQRAAEAPAKGALARNLVQLAQADTDKAGQAVDAAADLLARLNARYHLDVTRQMPGESAAAYASRYAGAPQPAGPTGVPGG